MRSEAELQTIVNLLANFRSRSNVVVMLCLDKLKSMVERQDLQPLPILHFERSQVTIASFKSILGPGQKETAEGLVAAPDDVVEQQQSSRSLRKTTMNTAQLQMEEIRRRLTINYDDVEKFKLQNMKMVTQNKQLNEFVDELNADEIELEELKDFEMSVNYEIDNRSDGGSQKMKKSSVHPRQKDLQMNRSAMPKTFANPKPIVKQRDSIDVGLPQTKELAKFNVNQKNERNLFSSMVTTTNKGIKVNYTVDGVDEINDEDEQPEPEDALAKAVQKHQQSAVKPVAEPKVRVNQKKKKADLNMIAEEPNDANRMHIREEDEEEEEENDSSRE